MPSLNKFKRRKLSESEVLAILPRYLDRFWARVNKDGSIPDYAPHLGPCWQWIAYTYPTGYGNISIMTNNFLAHRVAWLAMHGSFPPHPLEIDHLCRNRGCVNPSHLEAVTRKVNDLRGVSPWAKNARKTHCINGHIFLGRNLKIVDGKRACRVCLYISDRRYKEKEKRLRNAIA